MPKAHLLNQLKGHCFSAGGRVFCCCFFLFLNSVHKPLVSGILSSFVLFIQRVLSYHLLPSTVPSVDDQKEIVMGLVLTDITLLLANI